MSADDEAVVIQGGLSFASDVLARPVGLVAASWDGQGAVEWCVGDRMMLGLNSTKLPSYCQLEIDGDIDLLSWPGGNAELVMDVTGLRVGEHLITTSLFDREGIAVATGSLAVTVRDVQVRPDGGSAGEGIRLQSDPSRPTFDELWRDDTVLSIDGPKGASVTLTVDLRSDQGSPVLRSPLTRNVTLPMTDSTWRALSKCLRSDNRMIAAYDDAESCVLTVSRAGLGFAKLNAERPFRPLSWRITRPSRDAPTVRLVDQTDAGNTRISFFDAANPLLARTWSSGEQLIPKSGGLLVGQSSGVRVSIVLPADLETLYHTREWNQTQGQRIQPGERKPKRLLELINAHREWDAAQLFGDISAETVQSGVLKRIDQALCELVAGDEWARQEEDGLLRHWQTAVILASTDELFRQAADEIHRNLDIWADDKDEFVKGFLRCVRPLVERDMPGLKAPGLFVLQLADRPGALSTEDALSPLWGADEVRQMLGAVLSKPLAFKVARMARLGVAEFRAEEAES